MIDVFLLIFIAGVILSLLLDEDLLKSILIVIGGIVFIVLICTFTAIFWGTLT